ncbi:MAG: hypothetical protein AAGA88_12250 [Pseudomonadota bacterium]
MSVDIMSKRFIGPHSLTSPALKIGQSVLSAVAEDLSKRGQPLNEMALKKLRQNIEALAVQEFAVFDRAFSDLESAYTHGAPMRFDRVAIARFSLHASCSYAIMEAFAGQVERQPHWTMAFVNGLIDIGRESFGDALLPDIEARYRALAVNHGAQLTPRVLADDTGIKKATRAFLGSFVQHCEVKKSRDILERDMNISLCKRFKIAPPNPVLINGIQLKIFIDRIWTDIASNLP